MPESRWPSWRLETKPTCMQNTERVPPHMVPINTFQSLFVLQQLYPELYSCSTYRWTTFATNISAAVCLSETSTRFVGGAFAESSHTIDGLSPQGIFTSGILESEAGALINVFVPSSRSCSIIIKPVYVAESRNITIVAPSAQGAAVSCKT